MDVADFCKASKVMIVAGKGGVGRTTVAATVTKMAADAGLTVLIIELEGKSGLPKCFSLGENSLNFTETEFSPRITARLLTPDEALIEYLSDHGMKRISKKLAQSGVLDVVATAIPGIRDILVLGKIKQLERSDAYDLIVVDAPATGHTLSFLGSAKGLLESARSGPVKQQATDVLELLNDPRRCQVLLVTLAEETPVNEAIEAAYGLEDRVGIKLGPIVINTVMECRDFANLSDKPPSDILSEIDIDTLQRAKNFYEIRSSFQHEQIARLSSELPLSQIILPDLFTSDIDINDLAVLAKSFKHGVELLHASKV